MIGEFKFNEIESSSFNLVCKSIKRPLLPPAKVKRVELPAASGVYDFVDLEYGLREVTMRITYVGTSFSDMRSKARDIAEWLSTSTWGKLIINDETDKYYLAKVTAATDLTALFEAGQVDIVFECQPYAYAVTEEEIVTNPFTSPIEFTNPGTRAINYKSPVGSKFTITVVGSWSTLTLALNGKTLTYDDSVSSQTLIIDNYDMTATLDSVNVFGNLIGNIDTFLHIIPGANSLAVTGDSLSLTSVTVNYIPLWV